MAAMSPNWSHTEPIRQGHVGIAMLIALSIAFARAFAGLNADYAQRCPARCKNKMGLVEFKITFERFQARDLHGDLYPAR